MCYACPKFWKFLPECTVLVFLFMWCFCLPYSWHICSSWSHSIAHAVALASAVAPFSVCDVFWYILLLTVSILPTFPKSLSLTHTHTHTHTVNHVVFASLLSLFTLMAFWINQQTHICHTVVRSRREAKMHHFGCLISKACSWAQVDDFCSNPSDVLMRKQNCDFSFSRYIPAS